MPLLSVKKRGVVSQHLADVYSTVSCHCCVVSFHNQTTERLLVLFVACGSRKHGFNFGRHTRLKKPVFPHIMKVP